MSTRNLVIVTGNAGKAKEFSTILKDFNVINENLDLEEIQEHPFKIAERKAILAAKHFNKPIIIEDTSLFLEEYGPWIGPYCKWFGKDSNGNDNPELQCRNIVKMSIGCINKTLIAWCIIAYCEPDSKPVLFIGEYKGICCTYEEGFGPHGFGWGSIMMDQSSGKSFAQLLPEEKNKISHRALALKKLEEYFRSKNI